MSTPASSIVLSAVRQRRAEDNWDEEHHLICPSSSWSLSREASSDWLFARTMAAMSPMGRQHDATLTEDVHDVGPVSRGMFFEFRLPGAKDFLRQAVHRTDGIPKMS